MQDPPRLAVPTLDSLTGGLTGGQGLNGIEKRLKWKLMFFAGACIVLGTGVIAILHGVFSFSWAMFTFTSTIFLTVFGILMVVLDFPVKQEHPFFKQIQNNAYKFLLFMTRFTGRGMWYLFLSSMVFAVLKDVMPDVLRYVLSLYLLVLGIAALVTGFRLSSKLDEVRIACTQSGKTADHFMAFMTTSREMSNHQFQAVVEHVLGQPKGKDYFNEDELDYVINALAFKPFHDGVVTYDELAYWLQPGPRLMV